MKVIGVIPARYASSRLPGKPLADICGKPMIWWVYQQALKVEGLDEVVVAVDDERVEKACKDLGIEATMTRSDHRWHISRIGEVAGKIEADFYVSICGDEPLIQPESISLVLPAESDVSNEPFVRSLMRDLLDPAETQDPSNIKVITNVYDECMLMTRGVVPFPYKKTKFKYRKLVGIECFNKRALDFFAKTPIGFLEEIEDIAIIRFIENGLKMKLILTDAYQLSVDTPNDLERVRERVMATLT
jgi:3-deoxy-manno-octulosonate cytidylyltransferase (CMP-KDO synthetase)